MSAHEPEPQFVYTYEGRYRVWCTLCDKAVAPDDISTAAIDQLENAHQCGPRTSAWDKP